jgi:hypothetical protein
MTICEVGEVVGRAHLEESASNVLCCKQMSCNGDTSVASAYEYYEQMNLRLNMDI